MKRPADDLERLISRYLDHEATARERRALERRLRDDPEAARLYRQTREIDDALRLALRGVVAGERAGRTTWPKRRRALRAAGLAAAACVGLLIWQGPTGKTNFSPAHRSTPAAAASTSWFAPPPTAGDSYVAGDDYEATTATADKPAETRWIVVPSEKPGEYLVIEVNRVPKRAVQLARDF